MNPLRNIFLCFVSGFLIASCGNSASQPADDVVVTPTPEIIIVTATSLPSVKPQVEVPAGWETPPSEVLLNYDPAQADRLPPPAKFTEIVAERKFQFTNPPGFLFRNTSYSSMMENKDKSIMVYLEIVEHKGNASAEGFLLQLLKNGKLYKATDNIQKYSLSKYRGWAVNIESPGTYEHGLGQIIAVDIDASNLFYAIVVAKPDQWEAEGKQIYDDVLHSLTFPAFQ